MYERHLNLNGVRMKLVAERNVAGHYTIRRNGVFIGNVSRVPGKRAFCLQLKNVTWVDGKPVKHFGSHGHLTTKTLRAAMEMAEDAIAQTASKTIALDFDDTFTADPDLWNSFIASAKKRGHTIIIATMRHPSECARVFEMVKGVDHANMFFTGRCAKKPFIEARGVFPDIWIDDNPRYILENV